MDYLFLIIFLLIWIIVSLENTSNYKYDLMEENNVRLFFKAVQCLA